MNIINKKCVSTIIGGISGNVTYNGKTINIPRGSRFEMIDGKVLINGKPFEQYNEADCPIIKIEITGNVESIETESGDVTIQGDASNIHTMSGDVRCNAVSGNVNTMSGDVTCDNIKGTAWNWTVSIRMRLWRNILYSLIMRAVNELGLSVLPSLRTTYSVPSLSFPMLVMALWSCTPVAGSMPA